MKISDAKHYLRQWARATRRSRSQNIYFHYDKHGGNLTLPEYLAAAERFPRHQVRQTADRADETTRFEDRFGRFLIVQTNTGLIVSYGENH